MKSPLIQRLFAISIFIAGLNACVPMKKYQELEAGYNKCQEDNEFYKSRIQELETDLEKVKKDNADLDAQVKALVQDTSRLGNLYRQQRNSYNKLSASYDLMSENKNRMLAENAQETKRLIEELEQTQFNLQQKEDTLKKLDEALQERERNLTNLQSQLAAREKRVKELEDMLARKDSAVTAIKQRVQDALLGFENNGLTIEQRNGKVYVSLDESLLFALGKYEVDAKGVEVLKKLAVVLEQNPDINITVEGHTDNIPLKGSGDIKDNWDLSVKRATSVVKIITGNSKVDPTRLTAAGRSEYIPLDDSNTKEGRQKNRRTEIILVPKLDELYEFLNEG
ncbi:MAG: OmpA family protein [Vicingaceae bacterium]